MNPYRTKRYQNTRELLNAIERHDTPEYDGKDTVITPTDGISIFSILNDNSFIAYYQGNVYRIPNGVVPNYDFDKFIFNTGSSPFKLIWDNVKLLKDRAVFITYRTPHCTTNPSSLPTGYTTIYLAFIPLNTKAWVVDS